MARSRNRALSARVGSDAAAHAAGAIWQTVQRQATMLAYLQVFRIMAVGCLVVMCVVLSLRKVNLKQKGTVGH